MPQLTLSACWWAVRWFPGFGYYERSCHVHVFCGSEYSFLLGNYSTVELLGRGLAVRQLQEVLPNSFPKRLCQFKTSSPSASLYALANVSVYHFGRYGRCGVVTHCGLNLCFPDDQWSWASFHVFVDHLEIFFSVCVCLRMCTYMCICKIILHVIHYIYKHTNKILYII